jgi:hypothetical protein
MHVYAWMALDRLIQVESHHDFAGLFACTPHITYPVRGLSFQVSTGLYILQWEMASTEMQL